jgi:hypothetical protein
LEVFDFAEQGMVTGSRDVTTVATQALYLLNDEFVRRQALNLAERVLAGPGDDNQKLEQAYLLSLGRTPTSDERLRAKQYLTEFAADTENLLAKSLTAPEASPNPAPKAAPKRPRMRPMTRPTSIRTNSIRGRSSPAKAPSWQRTPAPPPGRALRRLSSDRPSSCMYSEEVGGG